MRIELAHTADMNAVIALLAEQFREHGISLSLKHFSQGVSGLLSDTTRGCVLLAHDPEPVGVAVLAYTWTLEHGGPIAWLDELFVVPERRCSGIGRALLRRAMAIAKERRCLAIDLEVDLAHVRAERLYEREGFTALSRRRWGKKLR